MSSWFRRHVKRLLSRTYVTRNLLSSLATQRDSLFRKNSQVVTPQRKRQLLRQFLQSSGTRVFVETGTYYGDTLFQMSHVATVCHSIEISKDLYDRAVQRFRDQPHVFLHWGNSKDVLPHVLQQLSEPAFFWLDAHFQDHINYDLATSDRVFPIVEELQAILSHSVPGHLIAIDDMRTFGSSDYCPAQRVIADLLDQSGLANRWTIHHDILWCDTSKRAVTTAA